METKTHYNLFVYTLEYNENLENKLCNIEKHSQDIQNTGG